MLREQATLLSVQAERIKQEQLQAVRHQAPAGGVAFLGKSWVSDQGGDGGHVQDSQLSEKARLDRMYQVMESARKEELEKNANGLKNVHFKKLNDTLYEDNLGEKKLSAKIQNRDPTSIKVMPASKVVNNVEDDVFPTKGGFPFDDSDMLEVDDAEEQQKILEAIERRNEEKKKEEELTIKLINKLSLDESEECTSQNLDDGW